MDPETQSMVFRAIAQIGVTLGAEGIKAVLQRGRAQKLEHLEKFVADFAQRLSRLEQRCDDETITDMVNRALVAALHDSRQDKLSIFSRILEGTYIAELEDHYPRIFMEFAARFETPHLYVLKLLRDTPGLDRGRIGDEAEAVGFAFVDSELRKAITGDEADASDITTLALFELINAGLIHTRMQAESSGAMLVGINPVGLLRKQVYRLSPLGVKFAKYIETSNARKYTERKQR